jgi:chromosome segregation ATPase
MAELAERVQSLEATLQAFIIQVGTEFAKLAQSQRQTEAELRAFKEEMRLYREDTQAFKDEMRTFKDEMRTFKDEMREFREESRAQNREMNQRWGELARKMGTMVEDLVLPSLPRIIRERFGLEVEEVAIRRKREIPEGLRYEYDGLAVTGWPGIR